MDSNIKSVLSNFLFCARWKRTLNFFVVFLYLLHRFSTHVYDRVENETVERWASATKASVRGRRREINREYCCPYMQLVLL
jgi:hypothetical protein